MREIDEEETRLPGRRPSQTLTQDSRPGEEIERVIFTARPTLLFIGIGYAVATVCAILTVILLARLGVSAPVSLLSALIFLVFPAYSHLRRNTVRYTLTDARVEIDRGFFRRTTRNIPLRNIQDVTVSASLFKRLIGIGDLVIDNASEGGGPTVLHNIERPRQYAGQLLRELRRWQ